MSTQYVKRDWAQEITDQIIEQMEAGAGEWQMPWHRMARGASSMPHNLTTGAEYKGINTLLLGLAGCAHQTDGWASFKQWQAKGRKVAKGSKGSKIVFYKPLKIEDVNARPNADGECVRTIPIMKVYTVFNEDQLQDYEPADQPEREDLTKRIAAADAFVNATGADIQHGGGAAYYNRGDDYIRLPARDMFKATENSTATENYYSTLSHELTHWTGAPSRLERTKGKRFGDNAYAFEELVAELGAAFLCRRLGVTLDPRPDHAQYLTNWLQALKQDKRAIFKAAAAAQKAVTFLEEMQEAQPVAAVA